MIFARALPHQVGSSLRAIAEPEMSDFGSISLRSVAKDSLRSWLSQSRAAIWARIRAIAPKGRERAFAPLEEVSAVR